MSDASELQARTRARRRLIGAAVLLVLGVIAFPLLFETQPRPLPVDIPMVIPAREGAALPEVPARTPHAASGAIGDTAAAAVLSAPDASPSTTVAAAVPVEPSGSAAVTPVPASENRAPSAAQPRSETKAPAPAPSRPEAATKPAPTPAKAAEPARAPARESKPPPAKPRAEPPPKPAGEAKAAGRFVVQVGAYADDASARAARQRVERLGLKTYAQEVQIRGERRIRVRIGPFESRAEANKALETLKAGKLPGVVLTL